MLKKKAFSKKKKLYFIEKEFTNNNFCFNFAEKFGCVKKNKNFNKE